MSGGGGERWLAGAQLLLSQPLGWAPPAPARAPPPPCAHHTPPSTHTHRPLPARPPCPQESAGPSEDGEGDAEATYIWGTNLSVSRVQSRFNAFVRSFRDRPDEAEPKYMQLLVEVRRREEGGRGAGGGAGSGAVVAVVE